MNAYESEGVYEGFRTRGCADDSELRVVSDSIVGVWTVELVCTEGKREMRVESCANLSVSVGVANWEVFAERGRRCGGGGGCWTEQGA